MDRANKKPLSMTPRCKFVGGDKDGAFTGEQLRFPCKLRRYICARCGMHRGDHQYEGIRDEQLPPWKRSVFRRLVQFQVKEEALEEGEIWSGDVVTKGTRAPRRKRADVLWAGLRSSKFE
ncbi:hypothetical protein EJB05_20237, partial [Eragrostis curvula]